MVGCPIDIFRCHLYIVVFMSMGCPTRKRRPHMTEAKSVVKKNHFCVLTSFTGSVEKQSRAAPQEGKKLKKKIEGKKRRI